MAPLLILLVTTGLARLVGWLWYAPLDGWSAAVALGLAAMFLVTGSAHFTPAKRRGMVMMVPPVLPRPELLVTITGILELAGAVGLLVPLTRGLAAGCLALLLVVMFPANWRAQTKFGQSPMVSMPLWARTLTQVVFLAACLVVVVG
ncbi:DoxX family protein [Enemella evansiae]|uniref:DoxX family protein n=1 Tax=Enemella evansiae TaxID=2016499 RepID=UPI00105CDC89|nr:DoxX family protein [Enemella evansiae]TDO86216.1 putative membrane protein [Enemella evansiae]